MPPSLNKVFIIIIIIIIIRLDDVIENVVAFIYWDDTNIQVTLRKIQCFQQKKFIVKTYAASTANVYLLFVGCINCHLKFVSFEAGFVYCFRGDAEI